MGSQWRRYADLVVGAPGEALGTLDNAGQFHVMYGSATGIKTTGSIAISQNTAGVPGTAEAGDEFGYSQQNGDFNADGNQDVAVSAIAEDTGTVSNAGGVWIFYGGATGLRTDNAAVIAISDIPHATVTGDDFLGEVMAGGDFNGDGFDDLAFNEYGLYYVNVAYGTAAGLDRAHLSYMQSGGIIPSGDPSFGFTLSAGDIDGDGKTDLAIGAPYDATDKGYSTGAVILVYGQISHFGKTITHSQRFTPNTSGVPGSTHVRVRQGPS